MPRNFLTTSDLARAAKIHPNTVRLYEAWGFLSPVPRGANSYRHFSQTHLNQILLVRAASACTWLTGGVRDTAYQMIHSAAREDWREALAQSKLLLDLVQAERARAEAAAAYLDEWAHGVEHPPLPHPLKTGEAAALLDSTIDALRNWERNGLICVPRDPKNGYRLYGADEIGRLRIIRMLLKSRYSIMSVLRMVTQLDQGYKENLREALDTPRDDEDVFYFTDHWLSTLAAMEMKAQQIVEMLLEIAG